MKFNPNLFLLIVLFIAIVHALFGYKTADIMDYVVIGSIISICGSVIQTGNEFRVAR